MHIHTAFFWLTANVSDIERSAFENELPVAVQHGIRNQAVRDRHKRPIAAARDCTECCGAAFALLPFVHSAESS